LLLETSIQKLVPSQNWHFRPKFANLEQDSRGSRVTFSWRDVHSQRRHFILVKRTCTPLLSGFPRRVFLPKYVFWLEFQRRSFGRTSHGPRFWILTGVTYNVLRKYALGPQKVRFRRSCGTSSTEFPARLITFVIQHPIHLILRLLILVYASSRSRISENHYSLIECVQATDRVRMSSVSRVMNEAVIDEFAPCFPIHPVHSERRTGPLRP
jgi:hypothetical protein